MWGWVVLWIAYVIVVIGVAWIVLKARKQPRSTSGFLGKIQCWTAYHWAHSMPKYGRSLLGNRLYDGIAALWNYVVFQPNPLIQILYLTLVCGGYGCFVGFCQPLLYMKGSYVAWYHHYIIPCVVFGTLYTFISASTTPPGIIVKDNLAVFDNYKYDDVMYRPVECSTCHIRKIARSKHCRTCNHCVSRFDHHCSKLIQAKHHEATLIVLIAVFFGVVWLNQCVGETNYRPFIVFLVANSSMLIYGIYILGLILLGIIHGEDLFNARFLDHATNTELPADILLVARYLYYQYPFPVALFLLCGFMGIAVSLFLIFHIFLIASNKTTNEFFKWKNIKTTFSSEATPSSIDISRLPKALQSNPYNLESLWKNLREAIIQPRYIERWAALSSTPRLRSSKKQR